MTVIFHTFFRISNRYISRLASKDMPVSKDNVPTTRRSTGSLGEVKDGIRKRWNDRRRGVCHGQGFHFARKSTTLYYDILMCKCVGVCMQHARSINCVQRGVTAACVER